MRSKIKWMQLVLFWSCGVSSMCCFANLCRFSAHLICFFKILLINSGLVIGAIIRYALPPTSSPAMVVNTTYNATGASEGYVAPDNIRLQVFDVQTPDDVGSLLSQYEYSFVGPLNKPSNANSSAASNPENELESTVREVTCLSPLISKVDSNFCRSRRSSSF